MNKKRLFFGKSRLVLILIFGIWASYATSQVVVPYTKSNLAEKIEDAKNARIEFTEAQLFTPIVNQLSVRVEEVLKQSTIAQLDDSSLDAIIKNKPQGINFSLPFLGSELQIELIQQSILSDDFAVYTSDSPDKPVKVTKGLFYRGILRDDPTSVVGISFFDGEVYGMISSADHGNVTINKMESEHSYLIYSDRDLDAHYSGTCETKEPEGYAEEIRQALGNQLEVRADKCVKVYLETDYALYQNKGNNTNNVINYMTAVFNNIAILYSNESITTQVSEIYVWTTQDNYSKTSSNSALTQFRSARPSFNGDLAHLAALGGNNLGGIAWVNALCTSYKYAYSNITSTYQNVPTYSWTVEVMTHEMGHNLGSPHTHSCSWSGGALDNCYTPEGSCSQGPAPTNGGTIMSYCHLTSYGINFNNGFGTQPGNLIRSKVSSASCLGTCDNGSCNAPAGLAISNIQNTSATASWSSVSGATAYQVQYRPTGGTWIVLPQSTSTSRNITGLTAGTTYEVQVRSICASGNSLWSSTVTFTTSGGGGSCGTVTGLAASNITSTTATVSWSAVSGAVSYDLDYKLSTSSSWTTYNTTGTAVNFTGLTAGTTYNTRVRANCANGSGAYSSVMSFTTLGGSSYCTSKGNNSAYEWIDLVRLNTINNITGSNNGYGNYTGISTSLTKGTSYTATVSAGQSGGNYREYWTIWIDFNGDGDFGDTGESVFRKNATGTGNLSGSFTIPTNAVSGTTRMRVSMRYGSYPSSCGTFSYGEVEDYTVNIVGTGGLDEGIEGTIANLKVYPNPVNNLMNVEFISTGSGKINLSILDITGKTIQQNVFDVQKGNNFIPVAVENFQPGIYLIECRNDQNRKYVKVVKE